MPLGGGETIGFLAVEGHPIDKKVFFEERSVSPAYFAAMGIPLLEGRPFAEDDIAGRPRVAVVSRNFARTYFPNEDAIGKRFGNYDEVTGTTMSARWTIVGVVADVRQMNLDSAPPMQVYMPLWQGGVDSVSVVARTNLAANQLAADMRALVRDLDPTVAVADVHTMNELVSASTAERRFQTLLLTVFGGIALFLSLVGLYGLMAYTVQQRTAEIGIRVALGAQPGSVMRLVLMQASRLALAGIAVGFICAWGLTRLMTSLLFEVKPTDGATFFAVAVLFCLAALAACYLPARRATQVDPIVCLRYE